MGAKLAKKIFMSLAWLMVACGASARASVEDDEPVKAWVESEIGLPVSSTPKRLVNLDLGPNAENRFAVDRESIVVGKDGVIRYMMVVRSPTGATTISYEGIRCETRERRFYAYGRADGQWSRARNESWQRIEPRAINAYALVLYRDYFCPTGILVRDANEAAMALEKGGHPSLTQQ